MLQFTARDTGRFSMAETAQMALEGGCRWIDMAFPEEAATDEVRSVAGEIKEMCQEAGAFLVIRDRVDEARQLGLHGVYLSCGGLKGAFAARDALGPEAVVGAAVYAAPDIEEAARGDIDYVTLPSELPLDDARGVIEKAHTLGECAPVVHLGKAADAAPILGAGFMGINLDARDAGDDIAATVARLLSK